MSAIVGLYRIDATLPVRENLERMVETLAHRGPDGAGVWACGPVGLGHRMLRATPESLREKLPLANSTKDVVLTADARIDNRGELITALGLTGRSEGEITDSELILGAYERWGDGCPDRLVGDFAFAIWDARRRTFFCARDRMGVKPFYYHRSARLFAFASEIKALLCLPELSRQVNELRVAEYLAAMPPDTSSTFYEEVLRLPPAHVLTVDPDGTRVRAYWSLDPTREVHLGSDAEYAEAFRDVFVRSVASRLRSVGPVGSTLSGGLDSSSVTGVATQLLARSGAPSLHTFSLLFDRMAQCDERQFIRVVTARLTCVPHHVSGDGVGPFTDAERMLWHQDEPHCAPGLFSSWELYRAAAGQGVRTLLDGHDGDGTVSHGGGRLHELAQSRRWRSVAREVKGLARLHGESPRRMLWGYVRHYELEPVISSNPVLHGIRSGWRTLRGRILGTQVSGRDSGWRALLDASFARRVGLEEHYLGWQRAQPSTARNERQMHYRTLTAGLQSHALEVLDRAAAAFSIDLRHPFGDHRLVEFCLALPPEQKLQGGWSRIVMRRAMAGLIPLDVQWRADKTDFFPYFAHGLLVFERDRLDEAVLAASDLITKYVDVAVLLNMYRRAVAQPFRAKRAEVLAIWRAIALALWLRKPRGGVN